MVEPRTLFPLLALAFACAGAWRLLRQNGKRDAAARTWLVIAAIFALVSIWLRTFP